MGKLPHNSVVLGDCAFGIFGVAYEAKQCGHDFALAMKKANFKSLVKKAELTCSTPRIKSYKHTWQPTKSNLKSNPQIQADANLDVCLHEVSVSENKTLHLVSSVDMAPWTLASLYERRYDVEVDIRNLKVVMDGENIRAKSVDTFMKELLTSVVAYNLTSQFRMEAARINKLPTRRMSFKRTWTTFQTFLLRHMHSEAPKWRDAFARALHYALQDKLPNRPGRKFKREAYRKRPKDCQFEKREKPPSKIKQLDLSKCH